MKLKSLILTIVILSGLIFPTIAKNSYTGTQVDSVRLLYSLFSEYHKNKDYNSALPYGWRVMNMDTANSVTKWMVSKMDDILTWFHDSSGLSAEEKAWIPDTIIYIYNLGLTFDEPNTKYYRFKIAFIKDYWKTTEVDELIEAWETAISVDSTLSYFYYNRLGQLYRARMSDEPEYKEKALEMYTFLSEMEPQNPSWTQQLESLVDDVEELIEIRRKNWEFDKENLQKAWSYCSLLLRNNDWVKAKDVLEFLVEKSPETINYWNQLATCYNRLGEVDNAMTAYKKLIELEPDKKEHYLNLGIGYKDKNMLPAARTEFRKASQVGGNWALPIFYEGLLYEQSARNCAFDFITKCVYLYAQNTYQRALQLDPNLTQAKERIAALSGSIPTKEEYFFKQYSSGTVIPLTGPCFDWIGGSITVP